MLLMASYLITIAIDCRQTLSKCVSRINEQLLKTASLLAEVSHDEAKMRERRETSAAFRRVSYHACAGVSLTTSDVFLTCDTTHRTRLHAKLQLNARVCCGEFFAM